ncbi:MAG: Fic family protein [Desulfovibrio sp.]|jgi:cell filamentation protein|nr:Fic family protein [Desulfovibrio sp.]
MIDPYVYPGTETLKNLFGERDEERLKAIEADYTGFRIRELMDFPVQGIYNLSHLCLIHQYIFQDIYEWAGSIRTINMEKPESVLGGLSIEYSDVSKIERHLHSALLQLCETDWQSLNITGKADNISRHMAEIWKVHPFREGNTRAVVTFCCDFADCNKFPLDRALFKENSAYVRTALVAASAVFQDLGDRAKPEYLIKVVQDAIECGQRKK